MQVATLVNALDHPHVAVAEWNRWGLRDVQRARQTLLELAEFGLTLDLLASLCRQLGEHLPAQADPDQSLDALQRFFRAVRSPLGLAALLERDPSALPMLLALFALGPAWQAILLADPEAFDLVRATRGQPLARAQLLAEAQAELAGVGDDRAASAALLRVRQRHTLRIAYGDAVLRHKPELVGEQLAHLAEAIVEAALAAARDELLPPDAKREADGFAVIALGRLGSGKMDYRRDLELLFVHDPPPAQTEAARRAASDRSERLARHLVKILADAAGGEPVYGIRAASLPDSRAANLAHAADDTVLGFDSFGRTWHREEMLRARAIAGDRPLAQDVLLRLEPWVYRRYLNRADETGIKALRRRILRRASLASAQPLDVRWSRGGLADLVAVVHYLQLLFGGEHQAISRPETLASIAALEQAGVLAVEERSALESGFLWLMEVLHRLQVRVGPEQSSLPTDERQRHFLARSLEIESAAALSSRCRDQLDRLWHVLERLLGGSQGEEPAAVIDLLLDPAPTAEEAATALAGYGFAGPVIAAATLQQLAEEPVPFLSTRRCRHFLSLIAERLLDAIGSTPDPDGTLSNLGRVSQSLGSKGVLWELFHFHPASLLLYVRLCAASPYLSDILTANPGMIDDLLDSLQLDRLPTRGELERKLTDLSRGSADTTPLLHDLKNASHLRIGVRDILGQDPVDTTHASLADVADFCLAHVCEHELAVLTAKYGSPTHGPGSREGQPCGYVLLGLGKLGSREPNYHSSAELALLYEAEGTTRPAPRTRQQQTTNNHFFTQLAQRVMKAASELTPKGRLYSVDFLLRPIGIGGAIAIGLDDMAAHFRAGSAPLWQWQALTQARPICGDPEAARVTTDLVRDLLFSRPWTGQEPAGLREARTAQERGATELNIKRARGGTLDIEWLAQLVQLRHAARQPEVLVPGTQAALVALPAGGCLDRDDAQYFSESYRFLRRIESGLRLLNTPARHDLPESSLELDKLALLLGQPNGSTIRDRTIMTLAENRRRFERIVESL
jgi:glutamate-ammonia-ligase adenylyltransferase